MNYEGAWKMMEALVRSLPEGRGLLLEPYGEGWSATIVDSPDVTVGGCASNALDGAIHALTEPDYVP